MDFTLVIKKNLVMKKKTIRDMRQQGMALVIALSLLLVFSVMGMMLMYTITSTVKGSGYLRQATERFYGAEGGVLSVAAYMTYYKRTDAPRDITDTAKFKATILYLGQTVRYPVGYSTQWTGADVRINSKAPPPPDDKAEVETVVFIPTAPVGYGNE